MADQKNDDMNIPRNGLKMTDAGEFVNELDGGVFAEHLGTIISSVCNGVANQWENKGKGKIKIEIDVVPFSKGHQVMLTHKLVYSMPTNAGKLSEELVQETAMYVNPKGDVTLQPANQEDWLYKLAGKKDEASEKSDK